MNDEPDRDRNADARDTPVPARLDEWLRAAAREPDPLPPGLLERAEAFITQRCRRRRRATAGLALAAAVVLIGTCWLATRALLSTPEVAPPPAAGPQEPRRPSIAQDQPGTAGNVTVRAGPGTIALPIHTDNPKVTIVWLYPARRPQGPEPR